MIFVSKLKLFRFFFFLIPFFLHLIPLRYKRLLLLSFVSNGLKDVKWCTGPDCPNAVKCDVSLSSLDVLVPEVECDCKHTFCFGCGDESHKPAICALVKKWEKKMRDDSETAKVSTSEEKRLEKDSFRVASCLALIFIVHLLTLFSLDLDSGFKVTRRIVQVKAVENRVSSLTLRSKSGCMPPFSLPACIFTNHKEAPLANTRNSTQFNSILHPY